MANKDRLEKYLDKVRFLGIEPLMKFRVVGETVIAYDLDYYSKEDVVIPEFVDSIDCKFPNPIIPKSKIERLKLVCRHRVSGDLTGGLSI